MVKRFCDRCGIEIGEPSYKCEFGVIDNKSMFMYPTEAMELCDDCKANRDILLNAFLCNKTIEFED